MVRPRSGLLLVRPDAFRCGSLGRPAHVRSRMGGRWSDSFLRSLVERRSRGKDGSDASNKARRIMSVMGATTLLTLEQFERIEGDDDLELLKGELVRLPPPQYTHMEECENLYDRLKLAVKE